MKPKHMLGIAAAASLALSLTACAGGSTGAAPEEGAHAGTVNWWTWDEKQAESYKTCLPAFQEKYPDITVNITQYAVTDYFTKLTAGFVAGNAPDAFQNSVEFLDSYAKQGQLEPLDDYIAESDYDLGVFNVGVPAFTYTDDKQYALPLDWAGSAFYYNKDKLEEAGLTEADVQGMTWNPEDGGTFDEVVARLTVDENGKRGDEKGFDKDNVAVYGIGALGTEDYLGQTTWYQFAASTGWQMREPAAWPTGFAFDDPAFVDTMDYLRGLSDRGLAPKFGQFTVGDTEQLGSGSVAMISGGSWSATTFAKLPDISVGIAPNVLGPDGKTRVVMSNSNGNMLWSGSKNKQAAWDWISFMGTPECQESAALTSGSFFPSIPSAMDALAADQLEQDVDLGVFVDYAKNGELEPSLAYLNGAELKSELQPLFEAYFSHQRDDDVWQEATDKAGEILAKQ